MKVRVTNIQRFSLQDGPGIRTTVFLKGCSLRCPWCSNPENISYDIQKYHLDEKTGKYGFDIDLNELYDILMKDVEYYVNNGGVTFSGGEALLQFDKLEPLLKKLKEKNISICVESCLVAPQKNLEIAIKYVDYFYVDLKLLDKRLFENVLKGNYELYISNIDYLFKNYNNDNITYRMPITKEYTLDLSNIDRLEEFLKKYKTKNIEIFKVHNLGESKYKSLGLKQSEFKYISDDDINKMIKIISNNIKNVKVNKL